MMDGLVPRKRQRQRQSFVFVWGRRKKNKAQKWGSLCSLLKTGDDMEIKIKDTNNIIIHGHNPHFPSHCFFLLRLVTIHSPFFPLFSPFPIPFPFPFLSFPFLPSSISITIHNSDEQRHKQAHTSSSNGYPKTSF